MEAVMDGAGAVSSYTRKKGFTSLTRTSTGLYTLTLADTYPTLLDVEISVLKTSDAGVRFQIKSETVSTNGQIVLNFFDMNSPGNLIDPVSCTLKIRAEVKRTNS